MLGSPVMVFASGWPPGVVDDSRDTLKTSVEHLLELWVPGRTIRGQSVSQQHVQAIMIGADFILKPREGLTASTDLHWVPGVWAPEELTDRVSDQGFDISGRLIIGSLFSVNQSCPLRLQHELVPLSIIRQEIHTLGTRQAFWNLQQIQAGLQVGQVANAYLNGTWLKSASRTKKDLRGCIAALCVCVGTSLASAT